MQNLLESSSPVQLEKLLQVPLQVIRLEDLLREKASSVSPTQAGKDEQLRGRLCRSADADSSSLASKCKVSPEQNPLQSGKSLSASCVFDCCTNPKPWKGGGGKWATSKDVQFKTTSLKLPDGSTAIVPVVDLTTRDDSDEKDSLDQKDKQGKQDGEPKSAEKSSSSADVVGVVNIVRSKNPILNHGNPTQSSTQGGVRVLSSATSSPSALSVTPPVLLGKVTENPTRYEDFLLAHGYNLVNAGGSNSSDGRCVFNGSTNRDHAKSPRDPDTLKLTFHNDGGKKDGDNVRYFENQQLQMSRVIRERERQPILHNILPIGEERQQPQINDNTQNCNQYQLSSNNLQLSSRPTTQPQLKLTSSIVNNISSRSSKIATANGKTWVQWDGLQISRCQKDSHRSTPNEEEQQQHCNMRESSGEKVAQVGKQGDSEDQIEKHLQAYLKSMKYIKPTHAQPIASSRSITGCNYGTASRTPAYPPPEAGGRSITLGTGIPQKTHSPPCGPAQITRVPNLHVATPEHSPSSSDPWPERKISRLTTRPQLRRSLEQPLAATTSNLQHSPIKRFRAINSQQTPVVQQHQSLNSPRCPNPNVKAADNVNLMSPHQVSPRNTATPGYGIVQQQQQQQHHLPQHNHYYPHQQHQGHASAIQSPQHSPLAQLHAQQQQLQRHQTQSPATQQRFQESLIIAAASASTSSENFDHNSYYDRLRRYWEYYQRQELDWAKLTEYYQKYNFYPWDILTARDESIRHWTNQQQQQQHLPQHHSQPGQTTTTNARFDYENMSQQQQHQLALQAMSAANSPSVEGYTGNKSYSASATPAPTSPFQNVRIPSVAPDRIPQANVSPSLSQQTQIQNKYNHNSQQLHQLQQIHQGQFQAQQQQQQQALRSHQEQQQKLQQRHAQQSMGIANFDMQYSAHYRNAYNQLAAAAAASSNQHHPHQTNQLRSNKNTAGGSVTTTVERNYTPGLSIVVGDPTPAESAEEFSYPVNIHRQALETAIKSNFSGGNSSGGGGLSNRNDTHGKTDHNIQSKISRTPPTNSNSAAQPVQQPWPLTKSCGNNGAINMTKDTSKGGAHSANTSPHQTSVIRRLQQPFPSGGGSDSAKKSPVIIATIPTQNERDKSASTSRRSSSESSDTSLQPVSLVVHKNTRPHQIYNYGTRTPRRRSTNDGSDNESSKGVIEANNATITTSSEQQVERLVVVSPVPMASREVEVIATVSPSAVLNNISDDDENENERDATMDKDSYESNGHGGGGWQYDHVVLLDKRIRTYMCKRCFETLKTEQQIRNHLFCKMLANHVQCHVCLQLVTAEAYPTHLQIHGVQAPETVTIVNVPIDGQ